MLENTLRTLHHVPAAPAGTTWTAIDEIIVQVLKVSNFKQSILKLIYFVTDLKTSCFILVDIRA